MKYLYSLLILFLFSYGVRGQSVSYTYDLAGNRIERAENTLKKSQIRSSVSGVQSDLIIEEALRVYPNPTEGILTIDLSIPEESQGKIRLLNVAGNLIYETKAVSGRSNIDIQDRSAGVYFLYVTVDGKTYLRKILKK